MDYLISIIVPIFNGEKYLKELLKSIQNQKYKNFELLLINDGSTDNTENICLKFKKTDNRINYYYKKNTGVSDSRNYGINKANGDYICFVDADDILTKSYLFDFVELINNNEKELYCCNLIKMKKPKITIDNKKSIITIYENKEKFEIINSNAAGYMCNKMFNTKVIKKNKIKFNDNIYMSEDFLFVIDYLKCCNKVIYTNKNNYVYRISPSSASKDIKNEKWFSILLAYDQILKDKTEYTNDFYYKLYYSYVLYVYQAKYRLNYIKNNTNYYLIKKDIKQRLRKINIDEYHFLLKDKIKLLIYKTFNRIAFYVKLKKEYNKEN